MALWPVTVSISTRLLFNYIVLEMETAMSSIMSGIWPVAVWCHPPKVETRLGKCFITAINYCSCGGANCFQLWWGEGISTWSGDTHKVYSATSSIRVMVGMIIIRMDPQFSVDSEPQCLLPRFKKFQLAVNWIHWSKTQSLTEEALPIIHHVSGLWIRQNTDFQYRDSSSVFSVI